MEQPTRSGSPGSSWVGHSHALISFLIRCAVSGVKTWTGLQRVAAQLVGPGDRAAVGRRRHRLTVAGRAALPGPRAAGLGR
jgi:hypothetical protein